MLCSRRRLIASSVLALALVGVAGCGGDDPAPDDGPAATTTSTSAATSTSVPATTTSAPSTTTTTADSDAGSFDGATTPTSAPAAPGLEAAAQLSDVVVTGGDGADRVTFTFDGGIPGYDVAYIDPPVRQDGSGDVVEVAGEAFLEIRFEPASGVDLGGTLEPTYLGPGRVRGDTLVVTEVVHTGDFEANLTWVAGVGSEVAFRVSTVPASGQVVVELDAG
jgi:hypothetical protein